MQSELGEPRETESSTFLSSLVFLANSVYYVIERSSVQDGMIRNHVYLGAVKDV